MLCGAGKGGSKEVLAGSFWSRIRALTPVARAVALWTHERGMAVASSKLVPSQRSHELRALASAGAGEWWLLAGDASAWCLVWSPGPTDGVVKRLHDMGEYLERGAVVSFVRRGEAAYPIRQHGVQQHFFCFLLF